jgi:hypothetical protein
LSRSRCLFEPVTTACDSVHDMSTCLTETGITSAAISSVRPIFKTAKIGYSRDQDQTGYSRCKKKSQKSLWLLALGVHPEGFEPPTLGSEVGIYIYHRVYDAIKHDDKARFMSMMSMFTTPIGISVGIKPLRIRRGIFEYVRLSADLNACALQFQTLYRPNARR